MKATLALLIIIGVLIVCAVLIVTIADKRARRGHNDKDYACRYWYGDRGGYDLNSQRCTICNPSTV